MRNENEKGKGEIDQRSISKNRKKITQKRKRKGKIGSSRKKLNETGIGREVQKEERKGKPGERKKKKL